MSSTTSSAPVGLASKLLSGEMQSQLAKLIHHSVKSRKDLCKELIATVESVECERKRASDNATPSPPRPHSSTSVSSDKENQRASGSNAAPVEEGEKDEKSAAAANYASLIDTFLEQSAVYDARKSLWVLNEEVKKRWAVADKLHPFFLHALTTPTSPSPKRRRSAPEMAGPSKKPAPAERPLVVYSPSPEPGPSGSIQMAEVRPSPGEDEEDLVILKKHRFKNVAVHVIHSPEIDAFLRRELPHAIDYAGSSPTTSRASSGRRQSSLRAQGKGKKTSCSRRQSVITGKYIRKKGKNKEVASSTINSKAPNSRQKSLNAFFKPSTPANSSLPSVKKRRLDAIAPSVGGNKSFTATPRSLAITAEDHRKQQLRTNARKIRKAVEEYNAKEAMKAARLAVKDFAPTAILPTAEELGINAFIRHLMARELAKKREKDAASTDANGGGEEGGPKKRGKKQPVGSNHIDDEGYRKMEKLLGQLMNGRVEDLLAKAAPLPELEPVPLPTTSPSAANDYTNFTMSLVLTEWLTTFADLLGIGGCHRLPSSLQLLDATVDSTRESFHHYTGRALKAMVCYFLTKTDVGRAMVEKKMIGTVRSAAEAELSGHRKGAATSIGNAFKTAKLLLGVDRTDELVSNKAEAAQQEEPIEDPAEQLFKEELATADNFWELPSDYQLELLRRMMELISDSNEFDTHLETSLSARSKAMEEKKEAEVRIAELLVQVDEAAANLPSTSDDALEQMTREQTRELVHKKKDLEAKQCELQELKERCQVLDTLLTQLKAGVSKLRVSPLGIDRWHRKYWFFTTSSPNRGLYVEDDGAGGCPEAASQMTELRTGMDFVERLQWDLDGWPLLDIARVKKSSRWYRIRTIGQFYAICASLTMRGVREEALRRRIKSVEEQILVTLEPGDDAVTPATGSSNAEKPGKEPVSESRDEADSPLAKDDRHDVSLEDESLEEARSHLERSAEVIEISDDEDGAD